MQDMQLVHVYLTELLFYGKVSKREVSAQTNLSVTTITKFIRYPETLSHVVNMKLWKWYLRQTGK